MIEPHEVLFVTDEDSKYLFEDLCSLPGIHTHFFRKPKSSLINFVKRVHINPKISRFLWLPKRDIWYDKKNIIERIPENGYLIINSSAMINPTVDFWIQIKKKRVDAKFVLVLVDSMNVIGGHMRETKKRLKQIKWDKVLSYDKNDCEKYGFTYIGFDYYSPAELVSDKIVYDLYYVSSVKSGRADILRGVNEACKEQKINNLFQIVSSWRRIDYGECFRQNIPYIKVLEYISKSNCILEILQDGQETQSLRYLEAICYNKKLLTNNTDIVDYPFYNPKFMKCFTDIEDIDWDWVKKRENINYKEHDFTSANLLKYL